MVRKRGVQSAQEVVTVERVILPGVLAIERDQDGVPVLAVVVARDLRQLLREILSRIVAVPGRVIEADAIRQRVVAEEAFELAARQRVRPVVRARIVGIRRAAQPLGNARCTSRTQ